MIKDGDSPPQARTANGELFGAPAGASKDVRTDNEIPHARSGDTDGDASEQAAPAAREAIRKHLESKLDNKTWTVLTPRPEVKVNGFEDPISDAFWKDVWVASASRNVSCTR